MVITWTEINLFVWHSIMLYDIFYLEKSTYIPNLIIYLYVHDD